ncbi:type 2 lanthipeptide synthetase LanM family protein [Caldicellulosiruptor morganii]|uniref:Type 2 lanthipeptide synthetase LanM family protein n=1 Tax=Caldicellulosiruptor morganii TaxID=1387555 RepID=A0ABY7BNZ9_9FIRM|nr:type 2 lanthipeptide synthetase LanM family protein [Caldicellulosiruptor morganii]WAM33129.1 type 2 lanthipeptide synthetase LanM family protein [Caldicellulosiruptor morganii]
MKQDNNWLIYNLSTDKEFTFDDVINYWLTLFPEIKKKEELEKLLQEISNTNFEKIREYYYSTEKHGEKFLGKYCNNIELVLELERLLAIIHNEYKWVYFFKPIIRTYFEYIYELIQRSEFIHDKNEFMIQILKLAIENLYKIAYRVLILELNIARIESKLVGETPEQRANYFSDILLRNDDYIEKLYMEYNELTRLMDLCMRNFCNYLREIIENTEREEKQLSKKLLDGKHLGKLKSIEFGAGDMHNGGRSVAVLYFDSGVKLIYKPRALDLEVKFGEFIEWLNNQCIPNFYSLKTCRTYTIESAGWVEFIEYKECCEIDEIKRFYYRAGEILCILYTLNARDMHFENIIAEGENPVLIDLETLFHPDLFDINRTETFASTEVLRILNNSVRGIGLLPTQIVNFKSGKVFEIGGLCAEDEQEAPFHSLFVNNYNTDEIKIEYDYAIIKPKSNNPIMKGKRIKSSEYVNEIINGFVNTYKWILKNKNKYIKKVREIFQNCKCRVIFKPTSIYAQLLATSYHPDLLRNSIDRKVFLHRIGLVPYEEEKRIVLSEIEDMLNGDVPYFTTFLNCNSIINSKGEKIEPCYKQTPLDYVIKKIESMNEKDLERQVALINMSYLNKVTYDMGYHTNIRFKTCNNIKKFDKQKFLDIAKKIGDLILEKSIMGKRNGKNERSWIGSIGIDDKFYFITDVGYDLYSGNSGIALFLAFLGAITGSKKYKLAAIEAMVPVISYIENLGKVSNSKINRIGAFSGVCGYFYALFHIGKCLDIKEFLDIVYGKIGILSKAELITENHDIISGLSGTLGVLLSIYDKTAEEKIREELLSICTKILYAINEKSNKCKEGITWGEEGYVGYSHGNAGVTSQLIRLFYINHNSNIIDLIRLSLTYERNMFDKRNNNWRRSLLEDGFSFGWCHGAPGILLSRINLIEKGYHDDYCFEEIKKAIEITKKYAFGKDYCLCHGDIGNLRILYYAAKVLKDEELKISCLATLNEFLDRYFMGRWCNGEFNKIENYGLMTGLSGVGYAFLQFCEYVQMPEILCLE